MDAIGAFLDEEWESLSTMFSIEGPDFLQHFNNLETIPSNLFASSDNIVAAGAVDDHEGSIVPCDNSKFLNRSSQGSGNNSGLLENYLSNGAKFFDANTFEQQPMQFYDMASIVNDNNMMVVPVFSDDMMQEILQLKAENNQPTETHNSCKEMPVKRKCEAPEDGSSEDHSMEIPPKKKQRAPRNGQKNKRAVRSKKNKQLAIENTNDEEEITNGGGDKKSSSNCNSEDNADSSSASQETNVVPNGSESLNSNGKAATRGAATDPQSLYARKRRERINERLRILQNLVPNGTKVDISTMLEEAVHYVKFLQLQIKLLSSDELWMYAPIAYNGMDMGLYQNISPNLWP